MRLAFMGTPDFSVPTLKALMDAGHEIVAVYTQAAKPAGRGKKERPSAVAQFAEKHGLTVYTPRRFREEQVLADFAALDLDAAVVVAYGQILPQAALDAPRLGCLNVHASLLPRWRGAAPIHRAVMAGDDKTGVCIMQMEAGLDTGPVILEAATPITIADTTLDLHDKLAQMGADLINQALAGLDDGSLTAQTQPEEGVTYAHKIDKAESRIDWSKDAETVLRHIHGLSPFPGAWSEFDGTRIKFLNAELADGQGEAGELVDDTFTIACGTGAIQVQRAQRPGKAPLDQQTFLRGFALGKGQKFV